MFSTSAEGNVSQSECLLSHMCFLDMHTSETLRRQHPLGAASVSRVEL